MTDLSTQLRGLDGEILMEQVITPDGPRVQPMTLGRVCAAALIQAHPDEQNLDALEKLKRFVLAQRVVLGGEIELKAEEAATIKTAVGRMYPPLIVGRTFELLDAGGASPAKRKRGK